MRFPIGSKVQSWGRFYNSSDVLADPTQVYVSVREPDGLLTTYTHGGGDTVKDGTGEYYLYINANKPGKYSVRWFATGTNQAATEDYFTVSDAVAR